MSKIIFALLLLHFCFLAIPAAYGQDMERVKATLNTLCSPAFHGRGYVNGGDRIAALYLEGQFRQMGLQAFDSNYVQPFTLDINTFPGRVKLQLDRKTLTCGKDYIVAPVSQQGRGRGRIAFLDTLIFTQEAARQSFLGQSFKRKVVVYESRQYARLTELPVEFLHKMHEAKALIELQKEKLTASVSTAQVSHPAFDLIGQNISPQVKKASFRVDAKLIKGYPSQNVIGFVPGKNRD